MAYGTWKTTGGGAQITAGGVVAVIGAVAVLMNLHAIERGAGELVAALAVTVLVLLVLAVAGFVLLARYQRRSGDRFADDLAKRRLAAVTAASAAASALPGVPVRSLPAAQPQEIHYHQHFHGPDAAQMFSGAVVSRGPGKPQITPGEEVPR